MSFRLWSYSPLNLPSSRFPLDETQWPHKAYRRTHYGQDVLWHEYDDSKDDDDEHQGRHLNAQVLEAYRQQGDPDIDRILELYAQEGRPLLAGEDLWDRMSSKHDNKTTSESQSQADLALQEGLAHYSQLPCWVDVESLSRGQRVFLAYFPTIGLSLYYRSLVPGFSIPRIAAVLQATAYLAPPASKAAVQDRLMDTGAFLAACLGDGSVQAILPNGAGWKAALQVRVLHAKVRRQLLARKTGRRQWDTQHLGIPINQEDMAATLLAFSTNAMLGCEMLLGRPLPLQDRLDYLALWRYLGWLLGVDVLNDDTNDMDNHCERYHQSTLGVPTLKPLDPCGPGWIKNKPNPMKHTYAIFQSIILHTLHPDASSIRIAHHLLRQGRRQDGDANNLNDTKKDKAQLEREDINWYYFRSLQCRRFVGDDLADALELALRPSWFGRLRQCFVSTVYLTFLTFYTVAGLPWSPIRERLVRFHRSHMASFMETWTDTHLDRMRKRLKVSSKDSVCPFAMVILVDENTTTTIG